MRSLRELCAAEYPVHLSQPDISIPTDSGETLQAHPLAGGWVLAYTNGSKAFQVLANRLHG